MQADPPAVVPSGRDWYSSPSSSERSSWVGGVGATRLGLVLTLLLLLLLATLGAVMLRHEPTVRPNPVSSSNSTFLVSKQTSSYRLLSVLCDSQETTTTVGESPPSTVGTPCDPTDLAATQSEYLIVVIGAALLFGLFFLIGFRLWST
jgi:hypothetical protein